MSATDGSKTDHLLTQAKELVMQHIEFDGNDRPEYVYTAPVSAVEGTPCTAVKYTYDGGSTRIENMREFNSSWQAAWTISVS